MSDAVRPRQPHGVVESPVDRFRVVAASVDLLEVGIGWCDRSDVLGSVELAGRIRLIPVQPNRDRPASVFIGKRVIVVPTKEPVLVLVSVGPLSRQLFERHFTLIGELGDSDGSAAGEQAQADR